MLRLAIVIVALAAFGGALAFTAAPAAAECTEFPCGPVSVTVTRPSAGTGPQISLLLAVIPPDPIVPFITLSQTIDASLIGAPVVSPGDPVTPGSFHHD